LHGYLDALTVILFALAPTLFNLSGFSATLAYLLAAVHLIMSLLTAMPQAPLRLIPFQWHGWVELVVAVILIIFPWVLGGLFAPTAQIFYTVAGLLIFVVWLLTDYLAQTEGKYRA